MTAFTFGPGDDATWPAYTGNPNDPRYEPEDEDEVESVDLRIIKLVRQLQNQRDRHDQ